MMNITHRTLNALESVRPAVARGLVKFFIRTNKVQLYQPIPWLGINESDRSSECVSRWQAIESELESFDIPGTAMDLGSQLGYFSFMLAERGWLCQSIEATRSSYEVSKLIQVASDIRGVAFSRIHIDEKNIAKLPKVDVVVFLSLWHHLCRADGFESAKSILKQALARTRRVMFFETGQSNEDYMGWSHSLPKMGPDEKKWIKELLIEAGSNDVRHLGEFKTHLGPVRRHLFAAFTGPS